MKEAYILDLPPDRMEGEVATVFFFEDDRPLHGSASLLDWRLNGALTDLLLAGKVTGKLGDTVIFQNNGKLDADWALFLGGGKRSRLSGAVWERLLRKGLKTCVKAGFDRIAFCLDSQRDASVAEIKAIAGHVLKDQGASSIECLFSFDTVPVLDFSETEKQQSLL
ncbi:MAG: hypothetical protein C0623_10765 [Desulfuromonas sp.]|nr:MAG: hypothetical protein C0623_10765 [Desulfuromonas sp.]